jgi:predicted ribosomally synthesized peptide with nif11-like leader
MSEEQLSALLAKLKEDAGLREKLKGAADLDAFLAITKDAGFNVSKTDWLKYQANQSLELSDEELDRVAGGGLAKDIAISLLEARLGIVGPATPFVVGACF